MKLSELSKDELSTRLRNVLEWNFSGGTLDEVARYSELRFRQLRRAGPATAREMARVLKRHGLEFARESAAKSLDSLTAGTLQALRLTVSEAFPWGFVRSHDRDEVLGRRARALARALRILASEVGRG